MSKNKAPKCKNMMYTQQAGHLPPGIKTASDLAAHIENVLAPKEYAVILHDQDISEDGTPAEAHLHAMLCFRNARYLSAVAKALGDKEQYVQKWDGEANNGHAYLIHATRKAQKAGKHPYDPCAVVANFNFPERMKAIVTEIEQAKAGHNACNVDALLDLLYIGGTTKAEIEKQLSGSQYAKYRRQIEDVDAKRLIKEAEKWRAEMKAKNAQIRVIWIYGPSGTGKTSLAKEYAQKKGEPYFVSGSSRDIFQGYNGEHTLILDELRPRVIAYSDLLRILDPHGIDNQVMAPCRYNDKPLACDLIIITTPYMPSEFYGVQFPAVLGPNVIDSLDQLARRDSLTIEMSGRKIKAMQYRPLPFQTTSGWYWAIPGTERPNPYSSLARPAPPNQEEGIYNSIFED